MRKLILNKDNMTRNVSFGSLGIITLVGIMGSGVTKEDTRSGFGL